METTAYIWGCGPPTLPVFSGGAATPAARGAALAHGWDPARDGAWAKEIALPARPDTVRMALAAEVARDPAVEGFSVP